MQRLPAKSLNDICLSYDQQMMHGSLFEYLLQRYSNISVPRLWPTSYSLQRFLPS